MLAWLLAFAFTQAVEVPIYVLALRCSPGAAFAASALTHPIVWFGFFGGFFEAGYGARLASAELFAWLGEAAWFGLVLRRRRALAVALLANAASLGLGFASRALFGVP